MKKRFNSVIKHPIISGSAIIFAGTFMANIFNFIFNLYMSRTLSIADYGILVSLISVILLFALAADSFVPVVINFAGEYLARGEEEKVAELFIKVKKISFLIGGIIMLVFIFFEDPIGNFLNIHNPFLLLLVGITVFFGFLGSINRAILQARLSFGYYTFISVSSSIFKLFIGVLLVFLGFKVIGAMGAFTLSFFIAYCLSLLPLLPLFKYRNKVRHVTITKLFRYGLPSVISLMSLTFFITSDILLVKHFYSPTEAGLYAGLSLLGKVIFFFSAPISLVMFPLIVQRYAKQENFTSVFKASLSLVLVASLGITFMYWLFPDFFIHLFLKKEEYLMLRPFVGLYGIFFTLYTCTSIVVNFYLSIKKTIVFMPIVLSAILQAVLIVIYHSTFYQVIYISIFSITLPLMLLLCHYWITYERK